MATSVRGKEKEKEKEKRGTSPSPSIKKSPKPLTSTPTSSSSSPTHEKTSSPTDNKPLPNYLKPTISSNLDFTRIHKKSEPDSSTQKATLNRRRSFDRPPPPAQVHKAIRAAPGVRDIKPTRQSSFNKTTTTSERLSVRNTGLKDGKVNPNLSKSRSLNKSTLSSTSTLKKVSNEATSSSSKKKAPRSVTSESSIENESRSVDHLVIEDEMVNIEHEVQSLPEISEMPESNKELGDPKKIETEEKHVEEEHKDEVDDPCDAQEDKSLADDHVTEEHPPHDHDEQEDENVETQQDQESLEQPADQPPTVEGEEQNNQIEEGAGDEDGDDQVAPTVEPTNTVESEENKEEELLEKEVDKGEEEIKANDEKQSTSSPSAASSTSSAPVKSQPAGKKENQAYNDVIEETATKLRGKKNKVLALAGAFETAISLQDNNNKN